MAYLEFEIEMGPDLRSETELKVSDFKDKLKSIVYSKPKRRKVSTQQRIPIRERLLLDYDTAAELLSVTSRSLRDDVFKGQGPAVTKKGTRSFFKPHDLENYVASLPVEIPYQSLIDVIQADGPRSVEENAVLQRLKN